MNKINFISDFFVDELIGGAEKCNDVLINLLSSSFSVNKIKSIKINPEFIKYLTFLLYQKNPKKL